MLKWLRYRPEHDVKLLLTRVTELKFARDQGILHEVTDEISTAGNVRHKTFANGGTMNIGFVSVMNNMYSVDSKSLKYRGCDEYAVAAAAVMVPDHNIQELLPDKLQYTIIDTPEYRYSTEETDDFTAYSESNLLTDKPHYTIVETPKHKNSTRYMLSETILISENHIKISAGVTEYNIYDDTDGYTTKEPLKGKPDGIIVDEAEHKNLSKYVTADTTQTNTVRIEERKR